MLKIKEKERKKIFASIVCEYCFSILYTECKGYHNS